MDLKQIYETIASRENLEISVLKPRMRVAIDQPGGALDIMKIDSVGLGRASLDEEMRYMAVAKVCPGQAALTLRPSGAVELNALKEVTQPGDAYSNNEPDSSKELGVLQDKMGKAYWVDIPKAGARIKRVTKSEMREIQGALP